MSMSECLHLVRDQLDDIIDEIGGDKKVERIIQLAYFKTKAQNIANPYDGF